MRFREFLEANGGYVDNLTGNIQGAATPMTLGSVDYQIPTTEVDSKIVMLNDKKNPIFIQLKDGTRLFISLDEFKRIPGVEVAVGRSLHVIFQRRPEDKGAEPSQIQSILCH